VKGWLEVADDASGTTLTHKVTIFIFQTVSQANKVNMNSATA
jgi:hypothetical protein